MNEHTNERAGLTLFGCQDGARTRDLQVMGLASCLLLHSAVLLCFDTPLDNTIIAQNFLIFFHSFSFFLIFFNSFQKCLVFSFFVFCCSEKIKAVSKC